MAASFEFIGTEIEKRIFSESSNGLLLRPFYRIRMTKFYGGCVTADTSGCSLHCIYCWNYDRNFSLTNLGTNYDPISLTNKMWNIAKKNNCFSFRISGAESILGDKSYIFIIGVIEEIRKKSAEENKNFEFIIETNGLYLGQNPDLCKIFVDPNIRLRISLKATNPEMFLKITGTEQKYFQNQLDAINFCKLAGVNLSVAVLNFIPIEDIENIGVEVTEIENLCFYKGVKQRMNDIGM